MSRSYKKKSKQGICVGSNTEYYREANRQIRAKAKQKLRMAVINDDFNDLDNLPEKHKDVKYNEWNEPTDGSILYTEPLDDWDERYTHKVFGK